MYNEAPSSPIVSSLSVAVALQNVFDALPDPRVNRRLLHYLSDILLLSLAAFCCGAEGFEDIETWAHLQGIEALRQELGLRLPHGIPHHDTFRRMLERLNPDLIESSLHAVRQQLSPVPTDGEPAAPKQIALDGKELRGSHDAVRNKPTTMLLSAYATDLNLVIGQRKIDAKSNEIPAAQEVLEQIAIQGATVTADAFHCQKETARIIRARGANYLLAVKDNQKSLHQALISVFETNRDEKRLPMTEAQTVDKDHGRLEIRRGFLLQTRDWLPAEDRLLFQWHDLRAVFCLECQRQWTHRGQTKTSVFTRYFISSSKADVEQHMYFARSHWRIENSLHWLMDVTFAEDDCRVRTGHAIENLATLRRTAAFLLKHSHQGVPTKSIRGRKKAAGWSRAYLLRTLTIQNLNNTTRVLC